MLSETLLQTYPWITSELLESILDRETPSPAKITRFELQPAIPAGENFSSQLIRVRIEFEYDDENDDRQTRKKSLIVKAALELVRSRNVFAKEIDIFTKIIPDLEQLFRDYGLDVHFGPKYYASSSSTDSHLILADLVAENHKNVRRQDGFSNDQFRACLKLLSKWHAGSAKLIHSKEWTLEEKCALFLQPHVNSDGSQQYTNLFENAVSGCIDAFQNDSDMQSVCDKLIRLKPNIFQKCCDAVQRDDRDFNVLTHGDLWSNNIMLDADSEADRLLFLDFQMCYWGSPILDVAYLLFTSASADITAKDWDALIEYYFCELVSTLKMLECEAICPSKEQFYHQFHSRAILGCAFSLFSVTLRMTDQPTLNAIIKFLDASDEGENFRHEIYSCVNARKVLKNLLLYFDEKGLLD